MHLSPDPEPLEDSEAKREWDPRSSMTTITAVMTSLFQVPCLTVLSAFTDITSSNLYTWRGRNVLFSPFYR